MKHTKMVAVGLAAVVGCGLFAGCDLVTTDPYKDYEQIIAEVDITKGADFGEKGDFYAYRDAIEVATISKRDMVASFAANGSSVMSQYGWTYKDTFDAICDSLINRQVYVQYAKAYFLKNESETYTVAGYQAAVKDSETDLDKSVDGLAYFLTDEEENKAKYDLRVSFNTSLDSIEEGLIEEEDEHDHDETVRTTPTGVDTEDEDYFAGKEGDDGYRIFTGTETSYGTYERVDGSTATTRKKAYATFLSNIRSSGLLLKGEDTSDIEGLSYFKRELRSAYESKLIEKIADAFEKEAEQVITDPTDEWLTAQKDALQEKQAASFAADPSTVTSALDSVSDSSFVLTAPKAGYGFVINILLPFSTSQTQKLSDVTMDQGDKQGNKFVTRASLLRNVLATDQRGTWFSGETDYSFEAAEGDGAYTGTLDNAESRKYLFFQDQLPDGEGKTGTKYDALKNYLGKYTYNGTVEPPKEGEGNGKYVTKPEKIDIKKFIAEAEGYLTAMLPEGAASVVPGTAPDDDAYYGQSVYDYYKGTEGTGEVNYEKFVYYKGKVNFANGFDANNMFVYGTPENIAFSVINELSFAYNTDTAGLNSYLGYSVTPDKTDFVGEFEYAAHVVCAAGAGNYIVVPSDYGWHFIYCTFSFTSNTKNGMAPFEYKAEERDEEGTFSNLYFEAKKSEAVSKYTSNKQNEIINSYAKVSATIYEDRFADLSGLDTAN